MINRFLFAFIAFLVGINGAQGSAAALASAGARYTEEDYRGWGVTRHVRVVAPASRGFAPGMEVTGLEEFFRQTRAYHDKHLTPVGEHPNLASRKRFETELLAAFGWKFDCITRLRIVFSETIPAIPPENLEDYFYDLFLTTYKPLEDSEEAARDRDALLTLLSLYCPQQFAEGEAVIVATPDGASSEGAEGSGTDSIAPEPVRRDDLRRQPKVRNRAGEVLDPSYFCIIL